MEYKILIKKLRENLVVSQEELAILLCVSFASVNRWENGRHKPTIKARRKILELCKVNKIIE